MNKKTLLERNWRSLTVWAALFASSIVAFPLRAQDTEIYRPSQGASVPHVMLLLDTSRSMFDPISDDNPDQRMTTMKSALYELLDDLDDSYHVGLARYTAPGGSILQPIKRLGDAASVETEFYGANGADDFLALPTFYDREERLSFNSGNSAEIGVRFANVTLPRGATIESAALVFFSNRASTGPAELQARMAQSGNAAVVTNQSEYVSNLWSPTHATWQLESGADLIAGAAITLDVTSQLASHLNTPGWTAGNAVLFQVSAVSGRVDAYSYEGAADSDPVEPSIFLDQLRPHLYVKYRIDTNNAQRLPPTTVRDALRAAIRTMPTSSDTPLIGAYFETLQYMRGGAVHFGRTRGYKTPEQLGNTRDLADNKQFNRVSALDSIAGIATTNRNQLMCLDTGMNSTTCAEEELTGQPSYQSPLTASGECAISPAIVMLTDGHPNRETCLSSGVTKYHRCDLRRVADELASLTAPNPVNCNTNDEWDCGIWLSRIAANPEAYNIANQPDIITYTIGFGSDFSEGTAASRLATLARGGNDQPGQEHFNGGSYYHADSGASLSSALSSIFENIADGNQIQAATGIAVDQSNRSQHMNQLYFSLFEPTSNVMWPGNLKRYQLQLPATSQDDFRIVDRKGDPAIHSNGLFVATSTSFWSSAADGETVSAGGAKENLPTARNIFSFIAPYPEPTGAGIPLSRLNASLLASDANQLNALLEPDTTNTAEAIIEWINRNDTMGSPLHSKPLLLHYGYESNDLQSGINTLFFSTNQGLLHAIDTGSDDDARDAKDGAGQELFAFAPKELLKNQKFFRTATPGPLMYGLDASWVAYRHDENRDGAIRRGDDDFLYLYGGMRGGGRNYYALDVTDTNRSAKGDPRLLFAITPDTVRNSETPFALLGQTWSVPVLSKFREEGCTSADSSLCKDPVVMIFGGGYDTGHEKTTSEMPRPTTDANGAALYMVNAKTGELLSWASGQGGNAGRKVNVPDMNYSITATVRTFDADYDGYTDFLYAVDLGGQVLRFDLAKNDQGYSIPEIESARIVATLGGAISSSARDYRRFYDAPAITQMRDPDGTRWISIAVGSGYRSHPMSDDTDEAFFMVRDYQPFNRNREQPTIRIGDLADASAGSINGDDPNAKGWYMFLNRTGPADIGEKVVGESFVLNENLVFATYLPASEPVTNCVVNTGHMALYQVGLRNAENKLRVSNNTVVRFMDNAALGLVSGLGLIQVGSGDLVVSMGTSLNGIDPGPGKRPVKTRWRSNEGEVKEEKTTHAP